MLKGKVGRGGLFFVVGMLAGSNHGVQLRQHYGTLGNRPELAPDQLIDEVAHDVVILFLSFGFLDAQL
jgi:hypothetical protein